MRWVLHDEEADKPAEALRWYKLTERSESLAGDDQRSRYQPFRPVLGTPWARSVCAGLDGPATARSTTEALGPICLALLTDPPIPPAIKLVCLDRQRRVW